MAKERIESARARKDRLHRAREATLTPVTYKGGSRSYAGILPDSPWTSNNPEGLPPFPKRQRTSKSSPAEPLLLPQPTDHPDLPLPQFPIPGFASSVASQLYTMPLLEEAPKCERNVLNQVNEFMQAKAASFKYHFSHEVMAQACHDSIGIGSSSTVRRVLKPSEVSWLRFYTVTAPTWNNLTQKNSSQNRTSHSSSFSKLPATTAAPRTCSSSDSSSWSGNFPTKFENFHPSNDSWRGN